MASEDYISTDYKQHIEQYCVMMIISSDNSRKEERMFDNQFEYDPEQSFDKNLRQLKLAYQELQAITLFTLTTLEATMTQQCRDESINQGSKLICNEIRVHTNKFKQNFDYFLANVWDEE